MLTEINEKAIIIQHERPRYTKQIHTHTQIEEIEVRLSYSCLKTENGILCCKRLKNHTL